MTYNMKIIYRDIKFDEIQIIKDIWEKNRDFHINISSFFNFLYEKLVFEDRMKPFESMNKDNLKITIAQQNDIVIGYCLSTINDYEGQMNTIHVKEEARGRGIGKKLMERHLKWMKEKECLNISLHVSCENENTIAFYEGFGFRKNTIEMRRRV
ncbi:ribosomal protein S18 acetylase RimI-like enzyme [Acetoanaerobium pronyense]|uniref:Ribosomal protein S18 acetylase RimI-like enzyme n=2 Tax=Acetoanaerobium pronyense TaxID=1482736 RepID=A0ABS4KLL0_9FIRM|nr:ribosomal protein S18 acetylase RimI-like enzyme [Acetoanaerobium pronyense]